MSYQNVTGPLMANSHPGSYCGQDAYNDMFVTEKHYVFRSDEDRRIQTGCCGNDPCSKGLQECHRPNIQGGGTDMQAVVRRLTPIETERLQGFPDDWTDIGEWVDDKGRTRQTTDSARYKSVGNSIALPYWKVLARRISAQYDRDITIGSLFAGIGGFEVSFEHCGGKALWSSEIEPWCNALLEKRFADGEEH